MSDILFIDTNSILSPNAVNKLCDISNKVVVIRYFSRAQPSYKVLTDDECFNIVQADAALRKKGGYFLLGIVHEINADPGNSVNGKYDGAYCRQRLAEIGAPPKAWIACAVDEDAANTAMQNRLIDYTKAFFGQLVDTNGKSTVTRAMYGPGVMLDLAQRVNAIDPGGAWVTESMGFTGSRAFLDSGKCDVWQVKEEKVAGLDADINVFNTKYTNDPNWIPEQIGFFVPQIGAAMA
jgi:hypothetical protein